MRSLRVGLAVAGWLCLSGCGGVAEVPEYLFGTWTTSAPQYAEHGFRLSKEEITFASAGGGLTCRVASVERIGGPSSNRHDVVYVNEDGEEYRLSLFYHAGRGTIRFRNQMQIEWTRAAPGP